jgi:hypothetical protein
MPATSASASGASDTSARQQLVEPARQFCGIDAALLDGNREVVALPAGYW